MAQENVVRAGEEQMAAAQTKQHEEEKHTGISKEKKIQQLSLQRATADRCNCRQTCAVEWVRAVCARLGGKVVVVEGLTDVLADKSKIN